mmetsp:Transcript_16611/g.38157  ORF Transcript_16611/g.38157 Transcript_16611/m.38157 type:complete len:159 (-) Transcript_16611:308-784(-)
MLLQDLFGTSRHKKSPASDLQSDGSTTLPREESSDLVTKPNRKDVGVAWFNLGRKFPQKLVEDVEDVEAFLIGAVVCAEESHIQELPPTRRSSSHFSPALSLPHVVAHVAKSSSWPGKLRAWSHNTVRNPAVTSKGRPTTKKGTFGVYEDAVGLSSST